MKILVDQERRICEPRFLEEELGYLNSPLQANSYTSAEVKTALWLHRPRRVEESDEKQVVGTPFLPYVRSVTDHIEKLLEQRRVLSLIHI